MIKDLQQRQTALEANKSFIVQAPAGSGKTGLLVYRMLVLLATVERPENVLAITFTRKATSEMRLRLIELLQMAEAGQTSSDSFEQQGIELASHVLDQDKRHNWQLLNTPYQLQILTIDAFCGKLTGHMPWLSRLGDKPRTTDNADMHYAAAVEQLFNELLGDSSKLSDDLKTVMLELDFNYSRARTLFNAMLGRRDQWLRHLLQYNLSEMRQQIQQSWRAIRDEHLKKLEELLPLATQQRLCELASKASSLIEVKEGKSSQLICFESYQTGEPLKFEHWQALKFLLLINDGGLRKRLTKNEGFPTSDKDHKKDMVLIIEELVDDVDFIECLQGVRFLPDEEFAEADWQQLLALENVLKSLAAFLQLRFRASGECDHSEVTQRANMALQELANPTDLALRLDYQIKHILVDEFQDTSHAQLQLLKKLTAGWESNDQSRTLFLVGDPMQSIYRFREADVGLFLQVVQNDNSKVFENINIQSLQLTENFRSTLSLVDWFNAIFSQSFPKVDQVLNGAISYANSTSSRGSENNSTVITQLAEDKKSEAQLVVQAIQESLEELSEDKNSNKKVAVLVMSRSHLKSLLPAIQQAEIAFEGVDIQPLQEAQAVIDVLALCKAINHLDDRIAWLAILRGPWCGLSLSQIKTVISRSDITIWNQLNDCDESSFDAQTQLRLSRFCNVMEHALKHRQQFGLHSITRWAWQSLGGPETLFGLSIEDVESVFDLIERCQRGGSLESISELDRSLDGLYAQPLKNAHARVVVSTMHKAKGLQYDTVILPCLANPPRAEQKDILMWAEHQPDEGKAQLLLAPIHSRGDSDKKNSGVSHYEYLRQLEKRRSGNEAVRLLYVASTRAERKLYLIARANIDQKTEELKAPDSRTLLATVWEPLQDSFKLQPNGLADHVEEQDDLEQTLLRLPSHFEVTFDESIIWQSSQQLQSQLETQDLEGKVDFEWATEVATAVGIVMHEWLQFNQMSLFKDEFINDQTGVWQAQWKAQLQSLNVPSDRIGFALDRLHKGVENMRSDSAARFIFDDYEIQKNEFEIAALENGLVNNYRIDRTFVDQDNVRWIVDYKTTYTQADDIDQFVDQQIAERHQAQLEKYGSLMSEIDSRSIKLAVYFPMLATLRSWSYEP